MRTRLREILDDEEEATKLLHQQLTRQLSRLDSQEENLVDLAADGDLASAKVKQRLGEIRKQRGRIARQLDQTQDQLALGAALIENALVLLADPQGLYRQMAPEQRRLLNQAIFEKLYVFEDTITGADFKAPFDELLIARDAAGTPARKQTGSPAEAGDPSEAHTAPLATVVFGGVSTKRAMVEVMGRWSKLSDQGERLTTLVKTVPKGSIQPKTRKPTQVARQLRPAEIEELVAGYQDGATVYQLAAQFRISRSTVSQHLEREDIPVNAD